MDAGPPVTSQALTDRSRKTRGTLLFDRGVGPLLVLPATILVVIFLVGPFYYMVYTALTDLSFADARQLSGCVHRQGILAAGDQLADHLPVFDGALHPDRRA